MIARAQLNVLHILSICLFKRLLHETLPGGNSGSHKRQEGAVWDTNWGCRQARKVISAHNTSEFLPGNTCSVQSEERQNSSVGQVSHHFAAVQAKQQIVELVNPHCGICFALTITQNQCNSQLESHRRVLHSIKDANLVDNVSACD